MPPGQLPSVREACSREERNCTVAREVRLHQLRVSQQSRLASETPEQTEARLHQSRVSQQCRLASEEREARLGQRSPRAVVYSPTVVGEEALGEDNIQQLLQPIVSYIVQYNQQYIPSHVLHPHTFSMSKRRRRRWKGVPVISHSAIVLCI